MSRAPTGTVTQVEHEVVRLSIDTGMPFGVFREWYELAVPSLDVDRIAATAENAPHGFTCCWRADVGSLMRLAGDTASRASLVPGIAALRRR